MTPGDVCQAHRTIALDSNVYIYLFEDAGRRGDIAEALLTAGEQAGTRLITSALAVGETGAGPARSGDEAMADRYAEAIRSIPNQQIVPVSASIATDAAVLRARHGTPFIDAIHIATAREAGATAIVTNDRRLRQVRGIDTIVLDDLDLPEVHSHGSHP
jgi:predicted nucleic acid-binding protein